MATFTCDLKSKPTIASSATRLTTHCIVVPASRGDYRLALASLQNQTEPVDAITAIGEPSAVELLRAIPAIRWMASTTNNEFAALNAALSSNSCDLLFFLSTGDAWTPDHLARMRSVYAQQPELDFVFCDFALGAADATIPGSDWEHIDLGFSAITTYLDLEYVGGPLSCLSMRRRTLERVIPLVDDADWNEQPEACLVFGASLAGARKGRLRRPLAYIAPGSPTFGDHQQRLETDFAYRAKVLRLVGKLARQLSFDPGFVRQLLGMEYDSQPASDWPMFVRYCHYVQLHQPDSGSRRRILLSMYRRIKHQIRGSSVLTGRLRSWWLKQRLRFGGSLFT